MSTPGETISTNPCPHCLQATGKVNFLRNRLGAFYTYCEGETHKFPDSDELAALVNQAKQKYPEHFPQKKSPSNNPPKNLSHFTVDPDNKKAIEELLGPIDGAGELKSAVWELKQQVIELNQQVQNAKSAKTQAGPVLTSNDQVIYRIPEVYVENVREMANHEDKPMEEYLQGIFDEYVEAFFNPGVSQRRSA